MAMDNSVYDGIDSADNPAANIIDEIIKGMARAFFVTAWADREEELGRTYPGMELTEVAPETPPEVLLKVNYVLGVIEGMNGEAPYVRIQKLPLDAGENLAVDWGFAFGWYLGMESLGHGVAWTDDGAPPHGLELPLVEFSWDEYPDDFHDAPEEDAD